jgi:hypothetical protein
MNRFYIIIWCSSFFCSFGSYGQSDISPFVGGAFDDGNTFAANGWTVVNSPGKNKWVIGSETYFSAPNSAYISVDGNPANYSYDSATAHISHFYQLVTIPANAFNVVLSFQLKGHNEFDVENLTLHDGLNIYADPTLTVPVADALPNSDYMVYPQFAASETYVNQTVTLDLFTGKTFLLIFTWINDGNGVGSSGPPASVDGVSVEYCLKSGNFNVTGGGAFCTGSSGVGVGLSGSSVGISYQLYKNGNPVGDPIEGTGSAIDFGPQKGVGTYTVAGSSMCQLSNYTYPMIGSVVVTENPLPVAIAGSNAPVCFGSALNLTSSGGISYSWTGPNGFTSTDQNPSIPDFSADAAGIYTVTVTANGCSAPATTEVTVTPGIANGGSITSKSVCRGGGGSLLLSGNSNNPSSWEYTNESTSSTWTAISNTTTTLNFSGITMPTFYRAVISDGCGTIYSDTALVSIHNYWTGISNSDWNNSNNWSDGLLPSTTYCPDVYIPEGAPNQPLLSGAPTAAITSLHIEPGATLTVNNTGLLQIGGTISNAGIFDVTAGSLEFNGNSPQYIHGGMFTTNMIRNLIVSNANGLFVANTTGDTLKISGTLSFGNTGLLNTGNNITLLSNASGTANVGVLNNNNFINGKVTVERYINTGGTGHPKSWQLLAVPTQGQTIRESWMEGATASNVNSTSGSAGNPHPGYGTMMTSNVSGAATFPSPGFDVYTSPGPSIKIFNLVSEDYDGPANTNIPVYNKKGYMILVRGDRSVFTSSAQATPTILRTTGTLFTPAAPPPVSDIPKDKYESIGNPYASAIDLHKVIRGGGTQNFFYVWDPKLSGSYGLGGFQTLSPGAGGDYYATPGGGSYSGVSNTIQSGQAFLVAASGSNGTISFNENSKINGSSLVLREGNTTGERGSFLRASLYGLNDSAFLADGNLVQYNPEFSNQIDAMDARKLINSSENFGIISGGKNLAIESRQNIESTDTIFYSLTGLRSQQYRCKFSANGLSAFTLQGFVEDTYLNTRIPLNMEGDTEINFTVTNTAGSYAFNRFRIVFAPKSPTDSDVPIVTLQAHQQDADIIVEWKVKNEKGLDEYEVESSIDGIHFSKAAKIPVGLSNYQWIDKLVTKGDYYYRIRYLDLNGKTLYSNIVKESVTNKDGFIRIYPNPIVNGTIHLQFADQPKGKYAFRLLNPSGQLIMKKQIELGFSGNHTEKIQWNYQLAHGTYQLEIIRPDGSKKRINVLF